MSSNQLLEPLDLADLYRDHHAWLFGWLRKKLGCPGEAADLAQDTFMKLLLGREVSAIREPRAYLTTTATRLMIDAARRRQLERAYLEALAQFASEQVTHSPEQYREVIELLTLVVGVLAALPEKPRQAFLMSRLEALSHAEIAARLGVSVSMVKQYIARALMQCCLVAGEGPA